MPITTAQLKAAIEAKIAAATGSTSLEDLTLIKNNADAWLANNSGGTITGYSSLETLIQAKQDALTGSSTIDDVTLTSAAVFPPMVAKNLVWKTQTFLTSGTFTRSAKMVGDTIWATGCAAGGSGASNNGSGGFGGAYCINRMIRLTMGVDSFPVIIPAGGVGTGNNFGNPGGDLQFGSGPVLLTLKGGSGGVRCWFSDTGEAANRVDLPGINPVLIVVANNNPTFALSAILSPTINGNVCGRSSTAAASYATGGAPGLYGNGTDASGGSSQSAGNNTGAGSGGGRDFGITTGNGGSGRLDLGWWEYE